LACIGYWKRLILPKNKQINKELTAQFEELAEQFELNSDRLRHNPAWQQRLQDIIEFLPNHVTADLITRMQKLTQDQAANTYAFAQLYGLTNAEEKLLVSLAAGLSVPDHAKKMGISVNTGRVHMQRILDKTAASGQLYLMKMLHKH